MTRIEPRRIFMSYDDVHRDATELYSHIQAIKAGAAVLVALARGGWLPTRLIANHFEREGLETAVLSLSVNYRDIGTPREKAVITQGFDARAIQILRDAANKQTPVWLIDGPFAMGKVMQEAKRHMICDLGINQVRSAVLHWVKFERCSPAPWRRVGADAPDAYARMLVNEEKPYIDYPWEHLSLDGQDQIADTA